MGGFSKEIGEFETLRANACIRITNNISGIAAIKKYFCQLHFFQNRFKIRLAETGPITFSWYDIYSGSLYTVNDFGYEMGCALYNSGAVHSC